MDNDTATSVSILASKYQQRKALSKPQGVPKDARPDVNRISMSRFETVKKAFMGRMLEVCS